ERTQLGIRIDAVRWQRLLEEQRVELRHGVTEKPRGRHVEAAVPLDEKVNVRSGGAARPGDLVEGGTPAGRVELPVGRAEGIPLDRAEAELQRPGDEARHILAGLRRVGPVV